jgi:hypothetical protein
VEFSLTTKGSFLSIAVVIAWTIACSVSRGPGDDSSSARETAEQRAVPPDTCWTGVVTIIWNGDPRYFLTTADGRTFRLHVDKKVARAAGGPLKLNRQEVIVIGEREEAAGDLIRVHTLRVKEKGQSCR